MLFCRYQPINKLTLTNLSFQKNWIADPLTFNDPMEFRLMDESAAIKIKDSGIDAQKRLENRNHLNKIIFQFGVVCYSLTYGRNNLMWSFSAIYCNFPRNYLYLFRRYSPNNLFFKKQKLKYILFPNRGLNS